MLHVRLRFRLRAMHHSLCNLPRTIVYIWALWASLYARNAQSAPSKNALEESCRQRWDGCEILPTGSDFRETLVQWSRNGRQKQTDLKKVRQAIRTVEKDGVWDDGLWTWIKMNQAMKSIQHLFCAGSGRVKEIWANQCHNICPLCSWRNGGIDRCCHVISWHNKGFQIKDVVDSTWLKLELDQEWQMPCKCLCVTFVERRLENTGHERSRRQVFGLISIEILA